MKMLMIIIDEAKKEELEVFLKHSGIQGYTELSPAAGMGATGPRLGSRAFPETSAVVFTLVNQEAVERLAAGVEDFCTTCEETLKMVSWDVDVLR